MRFRDTEAWRADSARALHGWARLVLAVVTIVIPIIAVVMLRAMDM